MATIVHTNFNPKKATSLEPLPVTITREYKNITVSLEVSGFTNGYGEIYYNAKDVKTIEKIMDMIKESF